MYHFFDVCIYFNREDGDHDNNIKYYDNTVYFADEMGDNELFSTSYSKGKSSFKPSLPGNGYQSVIVNVECHSEELIQNQNHEEGKSTSSTEPISFDFNYEYQPVMAQMQLKNEYQDTRDDSGSTK